MLLMLIIYIANFSLYQFEQIQLNQKTIRMDKRYNQVIKKISNNPQLIKEMLLNKGNGCQSLFFSLPPIAFRNIWLPLMKKKGFYLELINVKKTITSFTSSLKFKSNLEMILQTVLRKILPDVIMYQIQMTNTEQIFKRVIDLKEKWNLTDQYCGHIIGFLQMNSLQDQKLRQKQQKILNSILVSFDIVESKVDYYSFAIEILNQAVGQSLFAIEQNNFQFEQIYKKLITTNHDNIIYLLSKLKNRVKTFGKILSYICLVENNQDLYSQIKNIIILFLIFDYWHLFKEQNSSLKQNIVIQIVAQSFHRLMYLLYNQNEKIVIYFLGLLRNSNFDQYQEIKNKICYHLLGLFKLAKHLEKQKTINIINKIWQEKMKGLKINQIYLQSSQTLVSQSQKIKKLFQESQTISSSSFLQIQNKKKNEGSKSKSLKKRQERNKIILKWTNMIEKDLKNFEIQKVYLLLSGLKFFYLCQYVQKRIEQEQRPNMNILRLIVTVMKKISQKIIFRCNCDLLKISIQWELTQLTNLCQTTKFDYEQASQNLGLFQCCSIQGNFFHIESIVQMHAEFNFQESIETIMNIKILQQQLNTNIFHGKADNYKKYFQDNSFQAQLFKILDKFNLQNSKIDNKKMYIFAKLLNIKSTNITNNLLVNFAYNLFFQQNIQDNLSSKLKEYSKLFNGQIINQKNQERVKVLLQMGSIFEQFDHKNQKSLNSMTIASTSRKYLLFLRNIFHKDFYLKYSQIYKKFNYLKESIHFLQLFYLRNQQIPINPKDKLTATEIYQRLNVSFNKNMKFISAQQKLKYQQKSNNLTTIHHFIQQLILSVILLVRNQIGKNLNPYPNICVEGFPKLQPWLIFYNHSASFLIETISKLKVSEEIRQHMYIFSIISIFITIKTNQIKARNQQQNIKLLSSKASHLNQNTQKLLYRLMLEELNLEKMNQEVQNKFLQMLSKNNESDQLQIYLQSKKGKNNFQERYLPYVIRDHFQNKRFIECLALIKLLQQNRELKTITQLYQLQLQCQYNVMLNFTIQNFLQFLQKKCITSPNNTIDKDKHISYYFKIFRLLFQRYNFTKVSHNQQFLQSYFKFIDRNFILKENKQYISQTIFYLLRFILQKFYFVSQISNYGKLILPFFQTCLSQFVPFCDYLIKRISINNEKNSVIQTILVTVLTQFPKECVWIICFLKNFKYMSLKTNLPPEDEQQILVIDSISKKVLEELEKRNSINKEHIDYIDTLTNFGFMQIAQKKDALSSFKAKTIPQDLRYMFDPQYKINKIRSVNILRNGKSSPLEISISLFDPMLHCFKYVKLIIKSNFGCKKYRMQSNTANFFQEIGLLDKDITYRIFHLSKFLVLIEYVNHHGTLNKIIQKYCPQFEKIQSKINLKYKQRKEKLKGKQQKRPLEIYDNLPKKFQIPISQILILINKQIKSISDWWVCYTNFIKTNAQWSFLTYIVGLGDRHIDNILMTDNGKLIHIDFEYALDTGLKLPCPQWVPFRLTNCLIQPLGILGVFGLYYAEMITVAKQFQQKQANIWKALSNFVGFFQTNLTLQIINRSKFQNYRVRCVQQGISHIIKCAKNPNLLRLMYSGWRSYI